MNTKGKRVAMISGTVRDLPEHRKEVMDACLRQGVFPVMMEHLPASDAEAISISLEMVDGADIYIGVFAHRYGYIPKENNDDKISVSEMEYNRAVEQNIPRLIFVIGKEHPIKIDDVESGRSAGKLGKFLERVTTGNIVNFYTSPVDLRAHVINSLSNLPPPSEDPHDPAAPASPDVRTARSAGELPAPPEIYIAHPYTLLQTHELIGRKTELNMLTDWVATPGSEISKVHILSIVAIGGLGKSALTWKWFNDIAPQEMNPLAGRMWWSFYESEADFENFIVRALAYVSQKPLNEIWETPAHERQSQLLTTLDREPFLIVLDGLERVLIAYSRMDAARLEDTEVGNQRNLRKTADPRVGQFLKKLAQVKNSRILISTRLQPTELETEGGEPLPGTFKYDLPSLPDDDAVELSRALGVKGPRDILLSVFRTFGNHTLLIQALAGEVTKNYHRAPGDFERWLEDNPQFTPAKYPDLKDRMSHVLDFALKGLRDKARNVLDTIAAFRMPTPYETLSALFIGEKKPCANARELDVVLTELEDRGLVGWDKLANRYDLHPIVRGVVWSGLGSDAKQGVYISLHAHFEAAPIIENWQEIKSLEDLTPAIELYNTLIGMGRYDDAGRLYYERLSKAMLFRLSASRQRVEMIEMLFPDGLDKLPRRNKQDGQAYTLNALAQGYKFSGQPARAVPLYRRSNTIASESGNDASLGAGLRNLSNSLRMTGGLWESEKAARQSLGVSRGATSRFGEGISLYWLGMVLAKRGEAKESESALRRSLRTFVKLGHSQMEGVANAYVAQRAIWFGEYADALSFADHAWELANVDKYEGDFIRAARTKGEVALELNNFDMADERLHHALTRARAVNRVEEELPSLMALAELRRRQGDKKSAREFLDDVWEYAERGPYPTFHADALNVLAQIERDAGNTDKAIEAATEAYKLSWCDGPPYAYHWGLIKAQKHLEELGAPLPDMQPFDESKFEPMPEVEIDPDDEFHVGDKE